jgi:hypothetical protein
MPGGCHDLAGKPFNYCPIGGAAEEAEHHAAIFGAARLKCGGSPPQSTFQGGAMRRQALTAETAVNESLVQWSFANCGAGAALG